MAETVRSGDIIAACYRVERVLGTGGMGVVVAARHVDSGVLRAVKIMHREPADGAGWAARFKREALVGQRLRSEHAVRVVDAGGFEDGRPWLVMEHLEGTDLGKLLRKRGPLPLPEAAELVSDACEAIAEAHEMGVVHRDLKPANLFLAKRPDGSTCVKVLDFGISKVSFGEDPEALSVTQSGEVIGSPAYMAPEQIRAFGNVDPRSDVWALGVILYELVTGKWPFPGKASVEMIAMVLERQPDPPTKHRADVPPELAALLMHCLEKDPDKRLGSAKALQAALDPFVRLDDTTEDRPTPVAPSRAVSPGAGADAVAISSPAPVTTIEPQPVSVPPASTASQAVQRTLPIEPRAVESRPARVKLIAAGAVMLAAMLVMIAVFRRAPSAPGDAERGGATAIATAASTSGAPSAVATVVTAAPVETSVAPREPAEPGSIASGAKGAGDAPAAIATAAADGSPAADGPAASSSASADPAGSDGVWRPWNRPGGKPLVDAPRAGDGKTVDPLAASAALRNAALAAKKCKKPGGPTGAARVDVSFAPSGQPASVRVGGPFDGTPVGACIVSAFRGARMPAFQGSNFSASKTVTIK